MKFLQSLVLLVLISASSPGQEPGALFVTEPFLQGRVIKRGELTYPLIRRARIPGRVVSEIVVSHTGKVENIEILFGHPILDEETRRYLRTWQFRPLLEQGKPRRMMGTVTVWFDFAEQHLYGLELPLIRTLSRDMLSVENRRFNHSELVRWLELQNVRETRPIVRLLVKTDPSQEILRLFRDAGAEQIIVQYE